MTCNYIWYSCITSAHFITNSGLTVSRGFSNFFAGVPLNEIPQTQFTTSIPLSITNTMQRYTIFFIADNALHVSGGFSAHHQELKLYIQHLVYVKLAVPTHPR
jgi:hypothetical protein